MKLHSLVPESSPFIFSEAAQMIQHFRKEANIPIESLCRDLHISTRSYYRTITGINMKMSYYWLIFVYLMNYKYGRNEHRKSVYYREFKEKIIKGIETNYPFIF